MLYTSITQALVAVGAAATPLSTRQTANPIRDGTKFGLVAIRSGSDVQYSPFQAARTSILLSAPSQNATCDLSVPPCGGTAPAQPEYATFYLEKSMLYLHYAASGERQQLYADRSGLGQGRLGYRNETTENLMRNSETTGFALDSDSYLRFNNASFLACPGAIPKSFSIWVSVGTSDPAGLQGCVGIQTRAAAITEPISCRYTGL